jgi:hypothetical protein
MTPNTPLKTTLFAATAALCLGAMPALAASISVQEFSTSAFGVVIGAGTYPAGEDFETLGAALGEGEVGTDFATAVGTFNTLGGTGSGGTVNGLPGNSGTELALRDGDTHGRVNTVPTGGSWYLDSNDTHGMSWDVSTGASFDTVVFTLIDGSDTGAFLRISAEGASYEQRVGGALANGNASIVVVSFGQMMSAALIEIGNYTSNDAMHLNDGFAVDGMRVGVAGAGPNNPSPVPLPASGLLLAGALGLAGWRARKSRG